MTDSLHPTAGARFLLVRTAEHGARAEYRAAIYTPDAVFESTAQLAEDGTFTVGATGAPAELESQLAMQAKLLARGATKRREDGLQTWPIRVMRWRGPGRGS